MLKYEVGVNLLYPKIGEIDPNAMLQWIRVQRELCLMLCSPLNRKTMGISIHVRGTTKWGRRDCVTAHGLRTYCALTVSNSPRRRSPSVPVRMIRPGIRVVVGGTSTVSGSRRIIPNILKVFASPSACLLCLFETANDQLNKRKFSRIYAVVARVLFKLAEPMPL